MTNADARPQDFTLQDLSLAYRKAKADLYYASHAHLGAIVDFESELESNLENLCAKLNGEDEGWVQDDELLGGYILVPAGSPRSASLDTRQEFFSDPRISWKSKSTKASDKDNRIEFRLMAQNSMDFHVLSALWLLYVGDKFDAKLGKSAYGNRLRRTEAGSINRLSLGSFKPYMKPYRDWRDSGLTAIKDGLASKKNLIAISSDFTSYYHRLKPDFMLDQVFCDLHSVELETREAKLHRLFIAALQNWAKATPLKAGLPVGLPASAVVANLALLELDTAIEREFAPIYYGRYVDDIMLVLENTQPIASTSEMWEWLIGRLPDLIRLDDDAETVRYCPDYLQDCDIELSTRKTKTFFLDPEYGPYLVDSISRHIQERGSEWRALPNLPQSAENVKTSIVHALDGDGAPTDSLSKTDRLSARRAAFALKLRDFEAYARDLPTEDWEEQRQALFDVAVQHILVLPNYLDMAAYLPRLIRLATVCEDFHHLARMLSALDKLRDELLREENFAIKGEKTSSKKSHKQKILKSWFQHLKIMLKDNVCAAFPFSLSRRGQARWQAAFSNVDQSKRGLLAYIAKRAPATLNAKQLQYFEADLGYYPFRYMGLAAELYPALRKPPKKRLGSYAEPEKLFSADQDKLVDGLNQLASWMRLKRSSGVPLGIIFSTRPVGLVEFFLLDCRPFHPEEIQKIQNVILALRGFIPKDNWPNLSKDGVLRVDGGRKGKSRRIVLTSWKTEEDSWVASVMRQQDPDKSRYQRLMTLVDEIVRHDRNIDYVIFPECSMPSAWFMRLITKLRNSKISLIAGVEYIHDRKRQVRNQIWAALTHEGLGFPSVLVYKQDKQLAAFHEELKLKQLNNLTLVPKQRWPVLGRRGAKRSSLAGPPPVQHGKFLFAMLNCSELTNIQYRTALRGEIDALFVPEWNPDINTFESLIESAALDIHAFIIQCNDRKYGDSRIRAPYKDSWNRDLTRVRGGLHDYFVIGQIDYQALRSFQSTYRSPDRPFKPVPDGFQIAHERKGIIKE